MIRQRLPEGWVLSGTCKIRKVAIIGGRPKYDMEKDSWGSKGPFTAARALGLSILVIDQPGHWLEASEYAHLRDDFVAADMTSNDGLPERLIRAVQGKDIDGILTFSDEYVTATAVAAERLGLPTESSQAILQAHYKDETRRLLSDGSMQHMRLSNAQQLDDPSTATSIKDLRFHVIAKPCRGGASRGVKKVINEKQLREAINTTEKQHLAQHGVLIETYIDGPEVDANFVLWNGEITFLEISDDFPCGADSTDATFSDDFVETLMVYPSRLPSEEIEILRSNLLENLLKLGFRSGVFHAEARMLNSSMTYTGSDGILDLEQQAQPETRRPQAVLIEVNARPPGLQAVFATRDTYGVDFCALHFLRVLNDETLFKTLSTLPRPLHEMPEYWCGDVQTPIHRANILVPRDFFERVLGLVRDIAPNVSRVELFTPPGTVLSPRGGTGFVAYFLVTSRESRRHILRMSDALHKTFKQVLDNVAALE